MDLKNAGKRIIVALDGLDLGKCQDLIQKLDSRPYAYKIHDLWDREGPLVVLRLASMRSVWIWVDLKLKDIPNTVALRARAVFDAGGHIVTVHASGEIEMMQAAVESGLNMIFAVTVLTSLDEEQTHLLHGQPSKAAVLYQARLAKLAGVHGVVCSPKEVGILAKRPELKGMEFVVPGIRPAGAEVADQKRVDTPAAAIKAGATRLVIGRPITGAPDPLTAFEAIAAEVAAAMEEGDRNGGRRDQV